MLETEIKKLTEAVIALILVIRDNPPTAQGKEFTPEVGSAPEQNEGLQGGQPPQRPMTPQEFMPPQQGQQGQKKQTMGDITPPPIPEGGPKTLEDMRNFLIPIMKERGNAFVMQLMNNFGYQQLSQIPAERYNEFTKIVAVANAQEYGR